MNLTTGQMVYMTTVSKTEFKHGNSYSWARANKYLGITSFSAGLLATTLGCVKNFTTEENLSHKTLNIFQSLFLGIRSFFQYSIYSRKNDDDLGQDLAERPCAGNIGEVACFTEKYINPFLISLTSILGKNIQESYHSLCHLPNALWWRSRLFSEKISFKSCNKYLLKKIKKLFDHDIGKRIKTRTELKDILSPLLGIIGFSFCGLFTPIKSWNKLMGNENKIINALSSFGATTQHIVYLLKFSLSELFNYQLNKSSKSLILTTIGISSNALNIGLPVIDLLPDENNFIKKSTSIYKELASGLTMAFFSLRRHMMGKEWKENYSNNQRLNSIS